MKRSRRWAVALLLFGYGRVLTAAAEPALRVSGDAQTSWRGTAVRLAWLVSQCGERLRSEWRDAQGTLLAWDEVQVAGQAFVSYRLERPNLREFIEVRRTAGSLEFRTSRAGVVSTRSIAAAELIAGAQLVTFAQRHLAELRAGRPLLVTYLLADRGRTLDLELRPHPTGADGRISLDVIAASPLLRPFVPTSILSFAADGRFLAMSGQITPQLGTPQKHEPLVAEMTVRSGSAAPGPTSKCHI